MHSIRTMAVDGTGIRSILFWDFDNLSFMQDYSNQRFVRKYISDETSFDKIIETYENKPDGQPAFIFNVTMQNHGGYTDTYYGFDNTVTADKLNNSALDQYLLD